MGFYYDGVSLQNRRKSNMDSVLLKEKNVDGQAVCIAAVCDGVGSLTDGAFASSAVIRMLCEWFDNLDSLQQLGLCFREALQEINIRIVEAARSQSMNTGTTLSALLLTGNQYYIVHTGDSRIYTLENQTLIQLTKDQTLGGRLTACFGRMEKTDFFCNDGFVKDGRFLLCSDGLYKRMEPALLQKELAHAKRKKLGESIERLTQYVAEQGETDNISLAIVLSRE